MARKKAAVPKGPAFEAEVDPSQVVVLAGDADGARHMFLRGLAGRSGRRVVYVQNGAEAASAAARGSGALWVVLDADKARLADIVELAKAAGSLLVLDAAEDPPPGSDLAAVVALVGEARVRRFKRPPPWEESQAAIEAVRAAAQDQRLSLGTGAAEVLAEGSGADPGYLFFEVEKLAYLARARGVQAATAEMARTCAGGSLGPDIDRVAQALGDAGTQGLAAALAQVRAAQRQDPTPRLVAMLDRVVGQWLAAALLSTPDPERGARALGVHPYVYRVKIAGPAQRWKVRGTLRLEGVLADADLAVRRGGAHPWAVLCAGLFSACLDLGWGRL